MEIAFVEKKESKHDYTGSSFIDLLLRSDTLTVIGEMHRIDSAKKLRDICYEYHLKHQLIYVLEDNKFDRKDSYSLFGAVRSLLASATLWYKSIESQAKEIQIALDDGTDVDICLEAYLKALLVIIDIFLGVYATDDQISTASEVGSFIRGLKFYPVCNLVIARPELKELINAMYQCKISPPVGHIYKFAVDVKAYLALIQNHHSVIEKLAQLLYQKVRMFYILQDELPIDEEMLPDGEERAISLDNSLIAVPNFIAEKRVSKLLDTYSDLPLVIQTGFDHVYKCIARTGKPITCLWDAFGHSYRGRQVNYLVLTEDEHDCPLPEGYEYVRYTLSDDLRLTKFT